jgi:lipopolysaccharide transport system permease protein
MLLPMNLKKELLSEIWGYRELIYFFAWRDVKLRYKQAALGFAWALLQPLLTMLIFTIFFGRLAGISTGKIPYPLFSYCALVFWTYFSVSIGQAGQSMVANANLITKVYFPRLALPASTVVSGLLDLGIASVFLVLMMVYYRVQPGWALLWAPAFLIALVLLTAGTGFLLAALNVRYRDIKYALPFFIQLGLFVTPVIYPVNLIPRKFQILTALNPLSGIIEGLRSCILPGRSFDATLTAISLAITAAVFVGGTLYFRKTERAFSDII